MPQNIQKIDSNKDRQEAAIYAFTIVTIIFLPLSAIAGILGMNTKDIRHMEVDQWVFWAVSVPLTAIIITLCLMWAGEFQNAWPRVRSFWSGGSKKRSNYQLMPDSYDMIGQPYKVQSLPQQSSRLVSTDRDRYYRY